MRTRDRASRIFAAVVASSCALAGSCASNPTPVELRVTQEVAISSGKGAYAFVDRARGDAVGGELISSDSGRLLVLTEEGHLVEVPYVEVRELTLGVHDNHFGSFVGWGLLGSVSTISHGFFLVFTLPLWLATSIGAASSESYRGLYLCHEVSEPAERAKLEACLWEAAAYARFPQGLPPGVGAAQLLGRAPVIVRVTSPAPSDAAAQRESGATDGGLPAPYDQP